MDYSFNLTEIMFDYNKVYYQGTEYYIEKIKCIEVAKTLFHEIHTKEKNIFFFSEGVLHSVLDRPSVLWADGTKMWFEKGLLHRENDLPAVIWGFGGEGW